MSGPSADRFRFDGIRENNIDGINDLGLGNLIDALYKSVCRQKIVQPTFLIQHPIDLSPLARRNDKNPNIHKESRGWTM